MVADTYLVLLSIVCGVYLDLFTLNMLPPPLYYLLLVLVSAATWLIRTLRLGIYIILLLEAVPVFYILELEFVVVSMPEGSKQLDVNGSILGRPFVVMAEMASPPRPGLPLAMKERCG